MFGWLVIKCLLISTREKNAEGKPAFTHTYTHTQTHTHTHIPVFDTQCCLCLAEGLIDFLKSPAAVSDRVCSVVCVCAHVWLYVCVCVSLCVHVVFVSVSLCVRECVYVCEKGRESESV